MMKRSGTLKCVVIASCVALWSAPGAVAGPITPPPGPVSGTHKTLTEVEPRTAISFANTPGDANSTFRIAQPGSYYLAGNVTGESGRHGVEIAASGVTIDLNGFALTGVVGSLTGIVSDGATSNASIRNGTITGWGERGISINTSGVNMLVESVMVSSCGDWGITGSTNAVVRDCVVANNGSGGIAIATNGVIVNCSFRSNQGIGITTGNGASIIGCSVRDNALAGIAVGDGSVVRDCSVLSNDERGIVGFNRVLIESCSVASNGLGGIELSNASSVTRCNVSGNFGNGVAVSASGVVTDCTVYGNTESGIVVASDAHVVGNACDSNGPSAGGAGIRVTGSDVRVERNTCMDNAIGIHVTGSGNFIAANVCSGNGTLNWSVVANNKCLVVNAANAGAISGDSGGVSVGSSSPWTNFTY